MGILNAILPETPINERLFLSGLQPDRRAIWAIFECPGLISTRIPRCFTPIPTPGAKPAIPLPSREQQADRRVGLIPSIKQSRYRRGPAWRQPGGSRFLIQVSEYLVDHRRVFDAGDDAHITTAFTAGFKATASSAIAPALL